MFSFSFSLLSFTHPLRRLPQRATISSVICLFRHSDLVYKGALMKIKNFHLSHPVYGTLSCSVPFSMYQTLYEHGKIVDPYDGENEPALLSLSEEDWDFTADFSLSAEQIHEPFHMLRFNGIDTVADIFLNGELIGSFCNMHRIYDFDVHSYIKEGANQLLLHFHSPIKYIQDLQHRHFTWGHSCTMDGFAQIRKANYMFGWDWGPTLPDVGVYRPIELFSYHTDRLDNVFLRQIHQTRDGKLSVTITCEASTLHTAPGTSFLMKVTSPDGQILETVLNKGKGSICIDDPDLWWPHGYGDQPLYTVEIVLSFEGTVLDTYVSRLGLRTMTVSNGPDQWGKEFAFTVNGIRIFAMGASYVPEDNLLPRISPEKTRALLESCIKANFNCVRIWGGGFYCNDDFYDACDELGLVLWQDFMVACCNIRLSAAFKENVMAEYRDQIRRLRDHACIGLLCGNNEMEMAVIGWDECKDSALDKMDYLELYEHLIPDLCDTECPDIFYWPSSPSSGGGFVDPQDQNRGDAHYWGAWHGSIPFESYRQYYFRFCSEFGFEAFPGMKTIRSFAKEEDWNPFGPVMEAHQKCKAGNNKILSYLSDKYLYPYDFPTLVYASQLLQLDAIRYGVEHFRRFRGRCMGAIYWQLNDSWPVCSWSSVDYFGRWKALHYGARRFFSPLLLSVHENGTEVVFNLSNETREDFHGSIRFRIIDSSFHTFMETSIPAAASALSSRDICTEDFAPLINGFERSRLLAYELLDENGNILTASSLLFEKPRRFSLEDPSLSITITTDTSAETETTYLLTICAEKYASHVEIDFDHHDLILSDNYFDLTSSSPLSLTATWKGNPEDAPSTEDLMKDMTLRSVYNIGR